MSASVRPSRKSGLLADLTFQYVDRTPAHKAVAEFATYSARNREAKLGRLLRHHGDYPDGTVGDAATYRRDAFDYLLAYYGLLEIAAQLKLVPNPLPRRLRQQARPHLTSTAIRRYYEINYPLLLPGFFRERVLGRALDIGKLPGNFSARFEEFRRLSTLVDGIGSAGEDVERFLWMLDGGVVDGDYDIDDLVEVIVDPEEYARRMLIVTKRRDIEERDMALLGFGRFLTFAVELNRFLEDLDEYPGLQSLLWHHHGYWLHAFSMHAGREVLDAVRRAGNANTGSAHEQLRKSADEVLRAMVRLCSGRYSWRLAELGF